MATTITVTAFQTACAECGDAIIAQNWALAYGKYALAEAINVGLELQISDSGATVQRRESLEKLGKAIEIAEKSGIKYASTKRLITTRTSHAR